MPSLGRFGRSKRQSNNLDIQRQYLWNVPEGNSPDFSETYMHGENIPISWNALNNSVYDLWITSWNWDIHPVALCLARSVNLAHDGALNLINPNPPSEFFANKTRYVLRFKPPRPQGQYAPLDPEIVSPGFFIVSPEAKGKPVTSTTTTRAPAEATTSSSPSSPTNSLQGIIQDNVTSSPSSSQNQNSTRGFMASGAAAGLAIGLAFLVFMLVVAAVAALHMRRRRRRRVALPEAAAVITASEKAVATRPHRPTQRLTKWPKKIMTCCLKDRKETTRGGVGHQPHDEKSRGLFVSVEGKSPVVEVSTPWGSNGKPELPGNEGWIVHELYGGSEGATVVTGPVELPADTLYTSSRPPVGKGTGRLPPESGRVN